MRGFFFALSLIVTGPVAIGGGAVGIWHIVEGRLVEGVGGLFFGAFSAYLLVSFTYMWLASRKVVTSVCHLETLPGVIGGWFKASVEVTLPVETRSDVWVRVRNIYVRHPRSPRLL